VFFSIPELSEARIPQGHRLQKIRQQREMLKLDHFRFVPDDGGVWTLNGPLPRSNGWRTSPRFPTPGHSAQVTSQQRTGGTMRHCPTVRGSASGSRTGWVADLQIRASPYRNPAANPENKWYRNILSTLENQA
jgi:hypothetical protein